MAKRPHRIRWASPAATDLEGVVGHIAADDGGDVAAYADKSGVTEADQSAITDQQI